MWLRAHRINKRRFSFGPGCRAVVARQERCETAPSRKAIDRSGEVPIASLDHTSSSAAARGERPTSHFLVIAAMLLPLRSPVSQNVFDRPANKPRRGPN